MSTVQISETSASSSCVSLSNVPIEYEVEQSRSEYCSHPCKGPDVILSVVLPLLSFRSSAGAPQLSKGAD